MSLEESENFEHFPSSSEEQPVICLEHQCSKQYLFSMLQDLPQQEYAVPVSSNFYDVKSDSNNVHIKLGENFLKAENNQLKMIIVKCSESHSTSQSLPLNSIAYSDLKGTPDLITSSDSQQNILIQNETHNFNKNDQELTNNLDELNNCKTIQETSNDGLQKDVLGSKYAHKKRRTMGSRCNCRLSERSAKFHCNEFSDEERHILFKMFWENMNWHQRKLYVSSLVKCSNPSARRKECQDPRRKEYAFQYHLRKNNDLLRVCKVMFINTFSIGEFSVRDWAIQSLTNN